MTKRLKRAICFFRGHVRGRVVSVPPTNEQLLAAQLAGAVQIMTKPEIWCARCGREYNRSK